MLADPSSGWEAPQTLAGDALAFTAPAVALENGAAVAWPGACAAEQRPIGSAYRATAADPWAVIPSPATLLACTDLDQGMVTQVGVVRGPRLVVLAPTDVGGGPDTALAAVGTLPGVWRRALLAGEQSVTDLAAAGRFALVVWSRPEDGTALLIREYPV